DRNSRKCERKPPCRIKLPIHFFRRTHMLPADLDKLSRGHTDRRNRRGEAGREGSHGAYVIDLNRRRRRRIELLDQRRIPASPSEINGALAESQSLCLTET